MERMQRKHAVFSFVECAVFSFLLEVKNALGWLKLKLTSLRYIRVSLSSPGSLLASGIVEGVQPPLCCISSL